MQKWPLTAHCGHQVEGKVKRNGRCDVHVWSANKRLLAAALGAVGFRQRHGKLAGGSLGFTLGAAVWFIVGMSFINKL
jgi:hypothetical protein